MLDYIVIADYNIFIIPLLEEPMSELRKKQKAKRKQAIIEAAKHLISERGYRNTSIESVASEAEVGVATVYNYFSTKQELFIYFFHDEIKRLLKNGRKVLDNPPDEAQGAIVSLLKTYCGTAKRLDKKLLREIHVVTFVALPHVRQKVTGFDRQMIDQVTEMVVLLQKRGQMDSKLGAEEIASMFYSTISYDLMTYILADDMALEDLYKVNERHVQLLLKSFI